MLRARARDEELSIETRVMDGHALALENDSFDLAGSQFGVMVFPDMPKGIAEMARVVRPGGRVLINAYADPHAIEFLGFFVGAIQAAVPAFEGPAMDPLPLPFQLHDPERLRRELATAGLEDVEVETITEETEFRSGEHLWDWIRPQQPGRGRHPRRARPERRADDRRPRRARRARPRAPAATARPSSPRRSTSGSGRHEQRRDRLVVPVHVQARAKNGTTVNVRALNEAEINDSPAQPLLDRYPLHRGTATLRPPPQCPPFNPKSARGRVPRVRRRPRPPEAGEQRPLRGLRG